jgi:hypothetical protein
VVTEGQTEEAFLKHVVAPHLAARSVWLLPMCVLRGGGARGGGRSWQPWARHLRNLIAEHRGRAVRFSTFFDLFGAPDDTPGWTPPGQARGPGRADAIIQAVAAAHDDDRLLPFVQVHEFEALLFSDLGATEAFTSDQLDAAAFARLRRDVAGLAPEEVNDGPETAPSKRLLKFVPGYRKVAFGPLIAAAIGLPRLREACPRFGAWVSWLESLESP